jgi:hypothetical protein
MFLTPAAAGPDGAQPTKSAEQRHIVAVNGSGEAATMAA